MTGVSVLVVVVVLVLAFGLYRRLTDGRLRETGQGGESRTAIPQPVDDDAPEVGLDRGDGDGAGRAGALSAADLDAPLGERATLVQFSTAFCAPCRATRRTLDDVAAMLDGVAHVEVDAESHLDLVRRLNVLRTPTVLVLDAQGTVVRRASGAPRKADVVAALGEIL